MRSSWNPSDAAYDDGHERALRDLVDEWRETYTEKAFPCSDEDLAKIQEAAGVWSTAIVAAHTLRHWADVLERRLDGEAS